MARMKKGQLPSKICPVCGRPFEWRKRWARDWERVVYCSERCRREARRQRTRSALSDEVLLNHEQQSSRGRGSVVVPYRVQPQR
ncbi:MAG: DUF2256 domain-containing protein [Thermoflexales bacterium]|nr:DUF2256 domain-containing protein [Thermoflexales bacterium]MCS7324957.1 DUF2256 domain-containing protein [Thermoflexales bacterium]MCX7937906.1 DUF2256 domain-containing protein [Thermoflexales bacterium]MDW8291556.1 DUF2256 domain-containing protein [Anaerolineae bacterium]